MPENVDFNLYSSPVKGKFIFEEGRKRESSKILISWFFIASAQKCFQHSYHFNNRFANILVENYGGDQ